MPAWMINPLLWRGLIIGLAFVSLMMARSAVAAPEFYLVTFGPGEQVWERFGHNAIWLVDKERDEEALYNFGFFDFEQRGFFQNFLLGRMRYYAAATDPWREFPYYQRYSRSIEYQALNLNAAQSQVLAQTLQRSVQPDNREYLYDYFLANCSTRVRDAIDLALGGALQQQTQDLQTTTTFRLSSLAMVQEDFWLYLGMQLGLGRPSDRTISVWDSFYLPYQLRDHIQRVTVDGKAVAGALQEVAPGRPLHQELKVPYGRFAIMGLVSCLVLLLPWWYWRKRFVRRSVLMCRIWWLVSGLAGLLLCFLWLATDHSAAWRNENILLLNPLALLLCFWPLRGVSRWLVIALGLCWVGALGLKALPATQFNYDLLLWLAPAQLTALYLSYSATTTSKRRPT